MTWVTMKTPAASVQNSPLEFSAASNLGKCAGTPTRPWEFSPFSSSIPGVGFSPVLIIEGCFFCISPSQGLCCSQDCGFKPAGQTCDPETDCQRASVCSGLSPHCPEPSAKENLTVCSLGTRVCLNGVAIIGPLHLTRATVGVRCCTIKRGLTKTRPHFYLVQNSKCNWTKFSLLT